MKMLLLPDRIKALKLTNCRRSTRTRKLRPRLCFIALDICENLGSVDCLFCLFLWMPFFEGNGVSQMGFSLTAGAGVDGNAPYQTQELQTTTLANPGIQTNSLHPRPVQS